jgi:2,3-bisphosphoglycerate-independent phosphoglycerate mutase
MMSYSAHLDTLMETLFPPEAIQDTLGDVIATHHLRQLRIAETEKYAHVTFFFNGGREEILPGEERILIPSPAVKTYDQQPQMSAGILTDHFIAALNTQTFSLIVANYANADMVGHTGNMAATILAIEAIDECLGRLLKACQQNDYILVITADHGNAETMQEDGKASPHTAHTCNRVPLIIAGLSYTPTLKSGNLSDIAPTILDLISIDQPPLMTGTSRIIRGQP